MKNSPQYCLLSHIVKDIIRISISILSLSCFFSISVYSQEMLHIDTIASYSYNQFRGAVSHDFNGDGSMELICQTERLIRYERDSNNGYLYTKAILDTDLKSEVQPQIELQSFGPYLSDLDLDGDQDIVLFANKSSGLQLYWSAYEATTDMFSPLQELASFDNFHIHADTADLNGDGQFDLVVLDQNTLGVYEIIPGPVPSITETIIGTDFNIRAFSLGNLDGDSFFDLAYFDFLEDEVFTVSGNGIAGQFFDLVTTNSTGISGLRSYCLQIIDANDDQYEDLAVGLIDQNEVAYFLGSASGFGPKESIYFGASSFLYMEKFQLDNDGDLDLLVQERDSIRIIENLDSLDPVFGMAQLIPGIQDESYVNHAAAVADLNGDGFADYLLSKNQLELEVFAILIYCESNGNDVSNVKYKQSILANLNTNYSTDFADIDGDGDGDMLVVKTASSPSGGNTGTTFESRKFALELYENRSAGAAVDFQLLHVYFNYPESTTPNISRVYPKANFTDFDNDGDLDIIGNYGEAFWVENNATTGYASAVQKITETGGSNQFFDADNDGDLDLIYSGNYTNCYREFLEDTQEFGPKVDLPDEDAFEITSSDLDNDGDLDLLVNRRSETKMFMYRNGDGQGGQWEQQQIGNTEIFWAKFFLLDLNGDDKEDILGYEHGAYGNVFSMLKVSNAPNFAPRDTLFTYPFFPTYIIHSVYPYDANLDSYPDLLVTKNDGLVELYINDGTGHFPFPKIDFYSSFPPIIFFDSKDLTGDGKPELLGSHFYYESGSPLIVFSGEIEYDFKTIQGQVFYDSNENGQLDPEDFGIPNVPVLILPDNELKYTNQQGVYVHNTQDWINEIEVMVQPIPGFELTTVSSYTIPPGAGVFNNFDFGIYTDSSLVNAEVVEFHCPFLCNQNTKFWYTALNSGYELIDGFIAITLPPDVGFYNLPSANVPDSIVGNTYYYNFENLPPLSSSTFLIVTDNPDETFEGQNFEFIGEIYLWENGTAVLYDSHVQSIPLLCAFDPNDKLVSPNRPPDPLNPILIDDTLEYTIRFQNTGSAPAANVRLEDQLDLGLDWSTFQIKGSSHSNEASLDLNTGTLVIFFENIMLPDSAADFLGSQGAFEYTIQLKEDTPIGTVIENTASILFDLNQPIITNTTSNTLVEFLPSDCEDVVEIIPDFEVPNNIYCPDDILNLSVSPFYNNHQWYSNTTNSNTGGTAISGATDYLLEVPVSDWGFTYFYVEVQNDDCDYVSEPFLLDSYVFIPPFIESNGALEFCEGDSSLIAYPSPGGTNFQWYQDGTEIQGATDSLYWVTEYGTYTLEMSYEACPDYFLNSGVGPTFEVYDTLVPSINPVLIDGTGFLILEIEGVGNPVLIQWYRNGQEVSISSGGMNDTLDYMGSDDYQVMVVDENGCEAWSDLMQVDFSSTTDVESSWFTLYPNPTSDLIHLESASQIDNIKISNLSGQVLENYSCYSNSCQLSLNDYPSGVYFLTLISKDGKAGIKKLVKQ